MSNVDKNVEKNVEKKDVAVVSQNVKGELTWSFT